MKKDAVMDDRKSEAEKKRRGQTSEVVRMFYLILQIGLTMLVAIFMFIGIGWAVDHFYGTNLMVWFIIAGVLSGFRAAYILIRKFTGL